ncbi:MAG: hypothetical protein JNJ45_11345 [Chthonomonas sp.]|nr:hypothetical protein [Chthonomonas sp.]
MFGVLLAFLVAFGFAGLFRPLVRRLAPGLSETESIGIGGLVGLTVLGWAAFFVLPPRLGWTLCLPAIVGLAMLVKPLQGWRPKPGIWSLVALVGLIFGVVSAMSLPTSLEWDTLAYHFAVPKLWLKADATAYIPFIHHSNFPFTIDSLFMVGLSANQEPMARAFTVAIPVLGAITISGLLARRGHASATPWVLLLALGMPVMFSQLGTGYIDLSHGVYFGLGAVYGLLSLTEESPTWAVAGLLLGGALGSKTTGMLAGVGLVAVALVLGLGRRGQPGAARGLALAAGIALLISGGWFVRNVVNTGNPVYPFFYSSLGGRGWDQWRADTYSFEQKSFGVGMQPGHAILGLGYQPGRYINPNPQAGTGFPQGAVGAAWVLALVASLATLRRSRLAVVGAVFVGVQLAVWMVLSQQARYLGGTYVVVAVLAADLFARRDAMAMMLKALAGVQALYTVYLQHTILTAGQLSSIGSADKRLAYQREMTPFAKIAGDVTSAVGPGRVALYDEVFGYLLDCDYIWANPGHSMLLDQGPNSTVEQYMASLLRNRISHVYLNLGLQDKETRDRWLTALSGGAPFPDDERTAMMSDPGLAWKVLVTEAVRGRYLELLPGSTGSRLLFRVRKT